MVYFVECFRTNVLQILFSFVCANALLISSTITCSACKYEGWKFNSGNYLFTTDTKQIHVSKFYCPSVKSPALCTTRCQRCGSHKGLSPCDFHLISKMKEPLRGIRFRTVPEILQAVVRSIRTINTTGSAKGILRLPHRWQRVVHNAGDYIKGQ